MKQCTRKRVAKVACVLLFGLLASAQAQDKPQPTGAKQEAMMLFTGVWSDASCQDSERTRCSGFVLYLVQKGRRLCGDHFYSTLGAGRLNEGSARSVAGTVRGSFATVLITSGRDGSVFRAKIRHEGSALRWKRLQQVNQGQLDEPLIPEGARLAKMEQARDVENFRRVIKSCDAS